MTLRDDKPAIAAHVHALLVLLGARWHDGLNLERVTVHLRKAYSHLEARPEITFHESGGIRVVRDRDLSNLDVFVKVGSITFESPPCTCEEGELLDAECVIHPRRVPAG